MALAVLAALLIVHRRNRNTAGGPLSHHDGMVRDGSLTSTQGGDSLAGRLSAALSGAGRHGPVWDSSMSQRRKKRPNTGSSASHQSSELDPQAATKVLHYMSTGTVRHPPAVAFTHPPHICILQVGEHACIADCSLQQSLIASCLLQVERTGHVRHEC